MDRLTNRDKEIPLVCSANDRFWANVHEKLARYEDLWIEPDTLAEVLDGVSEWYDTYKDGRMVVLPCKVGDEFFAVGYSVDTRVIKVRVYQFTFDNTGIIVWVENTEKTMDWWRLPLDTFLKWSNFTSYEAAEAAYKGGEDA